MATTLQGFVYDNAGNAISGATVQGYVSADNPTTTAGSSTTTDSNGKWSISTSTASHIPMDIKITYGSNVRWLKGYDKINLTDITVSGSLIVGEDDTGHDVKMYGATAGSFLFWDESDDTLKLTDSTPIKIGDSADMTLYHDGSNSYITNATGALKVATETSGIAVTIGHTTSEVTVGQNLTVNGTIGSGNITSTGTVQGTVVTATTGFAPDASDGAYLGTSSLQFTDLFLADGAVINLGDDQDVTLTHVADTGILLNSTRQLQFGDSGTYIHQSADGVLDLVSDTEIEINATTIDINGAVDISGNATVGGNLTVSGTTTTVDTTNTVVKDALIELNTGAGSNSGHIGVVMERGSTGNNAIIAWDEGETGFIVGTTTATGASTGDLTVAAAPFTAAAIVGTTIDATTDFTIGDTVITDGVVTDSTGLQLAANMDINGTVDISSTLTLGTVAAAGTDTDKFLVLDGSGNVDYRTGAQVLSDIGAAGSKTYGISDDNAVEIDGADIADNEYARFTANGLESRTAAEVAADIEGSIDAVGTLAAGAISSGFGNIDIGSSTFDTTGAVSTGNLSPAGDVAIADGKVIKLGGSRPADDEPATANNTGYGIVVLFDAGAAVAIGDAVSIGTDGRVIKTVADATGTLSGPCIGVATTAAASADDDVYVMTHGVFRHDDWNFGTKGQAVYIEEADPGDLSLTAPNDDGDYAQRVGVAITDDVLLVMPSIDVIEHTGA